MLYVHAYHIYELHKKLRRVDNFFCVLFCIAYISPLCIVVTVPQGPCTDHPSPTLVEGNCWQSGSLLFAFPDDVCVPPGSGLNTGQSPYQRHSTQ